ncbi:MAG: dTDP-4-amino-4,6-dideoxygalactose transaminase [Variibacter sp.]|nr:dTDP-4-amino-4,6-dideoxygalactose transaminase [Variibacter sp.]
MSIPFNQPRLAGREIENIIEAVKGGQLAGDGAFTQRCEGFLRERIGAGAVLLTHSCTAALEMAAILLDLGPGDEVIMPSFNFVSAANAVALRGAMPVFVDIRADTLNLDERLVAAAISPRTRSIWPIHYAGVPAEMDSINTTAAQHGLSVIEDAAQALDSTYHGRKAGSLATLAAFSFHETKNVIAGQGGCLAINDAALIRRAEIIRERGTDRKAFFRGEKEKYTWVDVGSCCLPGELVASFLWAQLNEADRLLDERCANWKTYDEAISPWRAKGVRTPVIPQNCGHNAHIYFIVMPSSETRDALISGMRSDGIMTPFHYVPLHDSPAGRRFGRASGELPVTSDVSARLVRLPLFPGVGEVLPRILGRLAHHLRIILG